jgi:hypothetical protein
MPFAMLTGRWEDFDHDTETFSGHVLIRLLIHNGTEEIHFEFDWVDA